MLVYLWVIDWFVFLGSGVSGRLDHEQNQATGPDSILVSPKTRADSKALVPSAKRHQRHDDSEERGGLD